MALWRLQEELGDDYGLTRLVDIPSIPLSGHLWLDHP